MSLSASPSPPSRRRLYWTVSLLVVWMAGSALGFWWFTMKDLRSFAPQAGVGARAFDGAAVAAGLETTMAAAAGQVTVLHFWDPGCACSRFNQQHVRELSARYHALGVRFLVLDQRPGASADAGAVHAAFGDAVQPYADAGDALARLDIPASPAAAVFDAAGHLAYFGPYSQGAACLAGNGDFVEQVLDRLLAGERPRQLNTAAFGCFCDWNRHS